MAHKFHINDAGEPGKCKAKPGNCPLSPSAEHYDTAIEARRAFELRMEQTNEAERAVKVLEKNAQEAYERRESEKGKIRLTLAFGDTFRGWRSDMNRFFDPNYNAVMVRCPSGCDLYQGSHTMDDGSGHTAVSWTHEYVEGSRCRWGNLPAEYSHPFVQEFVKRFQESSPEDKETAKTQLDGILSAFHMNWNDGNNHQWEPRISYSEEREESAASINAIVKKQGAERLAR